MFSILLDEFSELSGTVQARFGFVT